MKALLDLDIYAFRSSAASENDDLQVAQYRVDQMIDLTLDAVCADSMEGYLSGDTNFRYDVFPEYKANRLNQKAPRHLKEIRRYLQDKYTVTVSDYCEADDLLGIAQCTNTKYRETCFTAGMVPTEDETIICSLDKDLRQIPGKHYSFEISGTSSLGKKWTKQEEYVCISEIEGIRFFYYQLLTGDPADGIKGAAGVGKVGANKILEGLTTEKQLLAAVRDHYSCDEELLMNGQCLWIFRRHNGKWQIPDCRD